ncbi:MAG TPA: sulfurtransferase [Candidatus Omnitrophica bacterium]|nr:sulfurtransferase [Candidatus Omnitrophota bacterium]
MDIPRGKTPEEFLKEAEVIAGEGITPFEAKERKERDPNTVILDVATPIEHVLLGKIEGALLLEQGKVPFSIKKKVHDARTPIIVTCSSGKRALLTAKTLKEMGYKNVTYIRGGLKAWKKAGLPTASYVKGEEAL